MVLLSEFALFPSCSGFSAMAPLTRPVPVGRSVLLRWLSVVYRRQEETNECYPDIPALGRLLSHSNVFLWTRDCHEEVLWLGELAGVPFSSYARELKTPLGVPGSFIAHPIQIDDSADITPDDDGLSTGSGGSVHAYQGSFDSFLKSPVSPGIADEEDEQVSQEDGASDSFPCVPTRRGDSDASTDAAAVSFSTRDSEASGESALH